MLSHCRSHSYKNEYGWISTCFFKPRIRNGLQSHLVQFPAWRRKVPSRESQKGFCEASAWRPPKRENLRLPWFHHWTALFQLWDHFRGDPENFSFSEGGVGLKCSRPTGVGEENSSHDLMVYSILFLMWCFISWQGPDTRMVQEGFWSPVCCRTDED